MRKSRYTDQQIALALKQAEAGAPVLEVCRKYGISEQTFYRWKKRFGQMAPSEIKKLKQLEEENRRLKGLILYAARNEALARAYRAWQRSLVGGLAAVLEACGAPRPSEAARIVVGVCRAFELEQLTHPSSGPDQLERRLALLLPGVVGTPSPSRSTARSTASS